MLVIVAKGWDSTATALAARWSTNDAAILTPDDLSHAGWRQYLGAERAANIVVAQGRLIPQMEITGVVTRLPAITADDLGEIAPEDREYVAAEMTAFMMFWLSRLKCPVLNRPSAMSLAGPYWRAEKWALAAAAAGIKIAPTQRSSSDDAKAGPQAAARATVTVIGERSFGDAHPVLTRTARRLAVLANAAMLTVYFTSPDRNGAFLGADSFPALEDDVFKDAALEYFCASARDA
ncbi:MAG TPA: hypothetical protein VK743_15275 [Steroidobacteraceae bacterium]|jgi:hypothetical protein|nr:hypothetical protein [Steroidobacteraceae bacterium]